LEQQQRHLRCESDTEADFLDRNEVQSGKLSHPNIDKEENNKTSSKSALNTSHDPTSDLDSVSTTSASYVLHHSDLDSMLNEGTTTTQLPTQLGEGRSTSVEGRGSAPSSAPSQGGAGGIPRQHHLGISSVERETSTSASASDHLQFLPSSKKNSFTSAENLDESKFETLPRRKKSSVSQLIARFENQSCESVPRVSPLPSTRFSRSVTPERTLHSQPSTLVAAKPLTQDQRPSSVNDSLLKKTVVAEKVEVELEKVSPKNNNVDESDVDVALKNGGQHVERKEENSIQSKSDHGEYEDVKQDETPLLINGQFISFCLFFKLFEKLSSIKGSCNMFFAAISKDKVQHVTHIVL